jgi:hypothetical protein
MYPYKDRSKQKWELAVDTESDWAGDNATREIVTGYSVFLMGDIIFWKSKIQCPVELSSSEAE